MRFTTAMHRTLATPEAGDMATNCNAHNIDNNLCCQKRKKRAPRRPGAARRTYSAWW
ncbi:hypothetical protein HanIR_Chr15g0735551 [Helianthus annuus]|nr:hypothetical protein HanIR_Chr15g0735551 [Helianthus annuus]